MGAVARVAAAAAAGELPVAAARTIGPAAAEGTRVAGCRDMHTPLAEAAAGIQPSAVAADTDSKAEADPARSWAAAAAPDRPARNLPRR